MESGRDQREHSGQLLLIAQKVNRRINQAYDPDACLRPGRHEQTQRRTVPAYIQSLGLKAYM